MSSRSIALVAIIISSLLWSTANVVTKILLRSIDPMPTAFLRFLIASIIMLPVFLHQTRKNIWKTICDVVPTALLSTGNIVFYYFGIQRTTSNASTILYTAVPLVTAYLSYKLLGETLTKRKIQGVLLGAIGVCVIVILPVLGKRGTFLGDFLGNLLIIVALLSWSLYSIQSRRLILQKKYSAIAITSVSFFTSTVILFVLTAATTRNDFLTPALQFPNNLLLLHLSILVTVATYVLYQWAIEHSSATTASLNNYILPVFSIGLAILILGEQFTIGYAIGSVLVVAGIILATGAQLKNMILRRK